MATLNRRDRAVGNVSGGKPSRCWQNLLPPTLGFSDLPKYIHSESTNEKSETDNGNFGKFAKHFIVQFKIDNIPFKCFCSIDRTYVLKFKKYFFYVNIFSIYEKVAKCFNVFLYITCIKERNT